MAGQVRCVLDQTCRKLSAVLAAPPVSARLIKDTKGLLRQRQRKSQGLSLCDHRSQVLADRVTVEGRRSRTFGLQRLGDRAAARLKYVWTTRRLREHLDDQGRIETEMAHQRVGLSETLPEHRQRQINGELHAGSGADRAKQVDAATKLVEHRLRAVEIPCAPPANPSSFPFKAGPTVPPTGHSQQRRLPRACTLSASDRSVSGCTVLISTKSLPATSAASRPKVPP